MLCGYPLTLGDGREVSCGQCMACRINKKREWVGRMIAEQRFAVTPSCFVTLTYKPDRLPPGGNLEPADLVRFTKYLRKLVGHYRYFAVAEYGDKSMRPHFHLALFGLGEGFKPRIEQAWADRGFVHVGSLTRASISYVAHYVTKKMTQPDDERLAGRRPEFTRSSKRPPIGWSVVPFITNALLTREGAYKLAADGPPRSFTIDRRSYPLGSYLFLKLCRHLDEAGIYSDQVHEQSTRWEMDIDIWEIIRRGEQQGWPRAKIESAIKATELKQHGEEKTRRKQVAKARADKLWRQNRRRQAEKI
jgi:hypothetical protein